MGARMTRLWLLALVTWAGCATGAGAARAKDDAAARAFREQFPTREALGRIAAAPAPAKLTRGEGLEVERWQLTGPLPDAIVAAPHYDDSPWEQLLEQEIEPRNGAITLPESLHCVARENGIFYLAKQALPTERVATFIAARCGAVADEVRLNYFTVTGNSAEASLFAQIRPQLASGLRTYLQQGGGAQRAGIWFGREDGSGRAVVMITTGVVRARLEPLPLMTAPNGSVTVQGELVGAAEHIQALINHGHFGFGRCAVDPTVALPRFAVTCDADSTDSSAWLEIAAFQPGHVVGSVVTRMIVWPQGVPGNSYDQAGYVKGLPAGPAPRAQLLGLINDVRHDAGLPPVALAERQSALAEHVAPHYFAALAGVEPAAVIDQVVLGLLAGWEAGGDIRSGGFAYGLVEHTNDLGRLVNSMLERPSGREALLDRAARIVALGPVVDATQPLVGLVASSYQLFDGANHAADAQRVLGRLTHARVMQHMTPLPAAPQLMHEVDEAAARVQSGQSAPMAAMRRMLDRTANQHPGWSFQAWVFEMSSLEAMVFPQDLLQPRLAGVAISVGHYRPQGAPWSRLVVFVIAAQPMDGRLQAAAVTSSRM
jgi:hypothetical protein